MKEKMNKLRKFTRAIKKGDREMEEFQKKILEKGSISRKDVDTYREILNRDIDRQLETGV